VANPPATPKTGSRATPTLFAVLMEIDLLPAKLVLEVPVVTNAMGKERGEEITVEEKGDKVDVEEKEDEVNIENKISINKKEDETSVEREDETGVEKEDEIEAEEQASGSKGPSGKVKKPRAKKVVEEAPAPLGKRTCKATTCYDQTSAPPPKRL
jgi:hypothetical protein